MRIFVIDAYGGVSGTNGAVHRYTVAADGLNEAIGLIHDSLGGQGHDRFDVVDETAEIDVSEPSIISKSEMPKAVRD